MSLAEQVQNLEDKMQEALEQLDQVRATFLVNFGPEGRQRKILTGDERVPFMQVKVLEKLVPGMTKEQFIDERTKIISKMLDNPKQGIYPTTQAFAELDALYDRITGYDRGPSWAQVETQKVPANA